MKSELDEIGCARLLETIIYDALRFKRWFYKSGPKDESDYETIRHIKEFARRRPNKIISAYCDIFAIDEERIRNALLQ